MKRRPQVAALMLIIVASVPALPIMTMMGEQRAQARRYAQAVRVTPQAREILHRNCYACHGGNKEDVREELDVLDHDLLIGSDRRIVVPGKPNDSRLIQRIADGSMPPEELETTHPRLAEKELNVLNEWILGGAPGFPSEDPENPTPPVVAISTIAAEVEEVFQHRCHACHKYDNAKGGIKILHHRLLLQVRKVIVPGNLDQSELFQLIVRKPRHAGKRLSAAEIGKIQRWIANGAPPFPKSDE